MSSTHLVHDSYPGELSGDEIGLVPGIVGDAVSVGPGTSYINLGEIRGNCFGEPELCPDGYTLAFWLKQRTVIQDAYVISNGAQTSGSYGINVLARAPDLMLFALKTKTNWYRIETSDVPWDKWNHLVMTWHPNSNLELFMNGVALTVSDKTPNSRTSTTSNDFFLGLPNNVESSYGSFLLDEMMFWEEHKSSEFIHDLFDAFSGSFALRSPATELFKIAVSSSIDGVDALYTKSTTAGSSEAGRNLHPCLVTCLRLLWCGAVQYDNSQCLYYMKDDVINPTLTAADDTTVVIVK